MAPAPVSCPEDQDLALTLVCARPLQGFRPRLGSPGKILLILCSPIQEYTQNYSPARVAPGGRQARSLDPASQSRRLRPGAGSSPHPGAALFWCPLYTSLPMWPGPFLPSTVQ